jgi:hypothetical protein
MNATENFVEAFDALLDEIGDAEALAIITGIFVSLTLFVVKQAGHSPDCDLKINGGINRDITIHKPKVAP